MIIGIAIPLILLFVFKYLNFVRQIVSDISGGDFDAFNIILPIGISFYSFQIIGYLIDIYRDNTNAERNIITYASYVAFFPQLLSGPIARTKHLLPQFKEAHIFNYDDAVYGLKRFAYGFFQKFFLANVLNDVSKTFLIDKTAYGGGIILASTVMYTLQIYFDFCGYSHMALGLAQLFGFRLDENFNSPYFSQSIKDFWSRWHISLTSWLRDYIYIPLGGNRCGNFRKSLNVLITFVISGLWHGANYTFIIWGALHGIAQIVENLIYKDKPRNSKGVLAALKILCVFMFVNFAWIFFRAQNLSEAFGVISNCFKGIGNPFSYVKQTLIDVQNISDKRSFLYCILFICLFAALDYLKLKGFDFLKKAAMLKAPIRWAIHVVCFFLIMYFTATHNNTEFIYFKF